MNPGSILIGLALLIASIPWVASPILNEKKRKLEPKGDEPVQEGDPHSEGLKALRDLDFDHQLGKVSEEDYINLRADLLTRIAATLEESEKQNASLDAQLEERILAHRQKKLAASKICSQCGAALEPSDHFCRACGAAADKTCPKCGHPIKASDIFCGKCGAPVTAPVENISQISPEENIQ